jgi:uncharacterized MAPEG superfamily protein
VDSWKIYGLTIIALFLKTFATILLQGYGRFRHRGFSNAEDAVLFEKLFGPKPNAAGYSNLVERAQSVLRNDGETVPLFLFLALVYIQLGCWPMGLKIYLPLYVFARVAHMISYIKALQPWRNLAFQLGVWLMFILSGHILIKIFGIGE